MRMSPESPCDIPVTGSPDPTSRLEMITFDPTEIVWPSIVRSPEVSTSFVSESVKFVLSSVVWPAPPRITPETVAPCWNVK